MYILIILVAYGFFFFIGKNAELTIKEISDMKFYYTIINDYFTTSASFSRLNLGTTRYSVADRSNKKVGFLTGAEIFRLDLDVFCGTAADKMLECKLIEKFDHIYHMLEPAEIVHTHTESDFFISIVKVLFSKLCEEVILSDNPYKTKVVQDEDINKEVVSTKPIGIGMPNTWHGYPDARMRSKDSSIELITYSNGSLSPGTSVMVEAKVDKITVDWCLCSFFIYRTQLASHLKFLNSNNNVVGFTCHDMHVQLQA